MRYTNVVCPCMTAGWEPLPMSHIVGIDLGTTNSLIAIWRTASPADP
jgi:molecular chaperone DnaK (HSP70)